jgi:hypothetical protein
MEHTERKYYIEVNDEEIEVEVLWEVTMDRRSYRSGDGWQSEPDWDYEILEVTNLKTGEVYDKTCQYASKDWEHAFEEKDARGEIQCYVQF